MTINFKRYVRRQGTDGNLYITIPATEERSNKIREGDLVEVNIANISKQIESVNKEKIKQEGK